MSGGKRHIHAGMLGGASSTYVSNPSLAIRFDRADVALDSAPRHYDTRSLICSVCSNVPKRQGLLTDDDHGGFRCVAERACSRRVQGYFG